MSQNPRKPNQSAERIGEIQKPNELEDQIGEIGRIERGGKGVMRGIGYWSVFIPLDFLAAPPPPPPGRALTAFPRSLTKSQPRH